jgi:short-subunit dehydrogenase
VTPPSTVNNVGRSHDMPVYFDQTPQQEVDEILQINIHGTLAITKVVLPLMLPKYAVSFFLVFSY